MVDLNGCYNSNTHLSYKDFSARGLYGAVERGRTPRKATEVEPEPVGCGPVRRPNAQSETSIHMLRRAVPVSCSLITYLTIKSACMRSIDPSGETISYIGGVAMGGHASTEITRWVDGTRVIDPGRLIESRGIVGGRLVDALGESIPSVGACTALTNHASDRLPRARHLDPPMAITCAGAIVILHQAGVFDAVTGGRSTDTSSRLLHNNGQDEAVVDGSFEGDLLYGVIDGADLKAIIVDLLVLMARAKHHGLIMMEPCRRLASWRLRRDVECGG